MRARFWGVRGSIPSPGAATARYGGNTACVSIHLDGRNDRVLVFDAGTGIRELGKAIAAGPGEIFILLSHTHWDHIQGFPFFLPIYEPNRSIYVFQTPQDKDMICSLMEQMDGAHFPVNLETLPSLTQCIFEDPISFLRSKGFLVSRIATNHPAGGYGFRVGHEGRAAAYITDNELDPPYRKATDFEGFVRFCQGADVLIHDAQYLDNDMPHKRGWGHSLVSQASELAAAARVKHLILYHHDPERSDSELDAIQEEARLWFRRNHPAIQCTVAYEGLIVEV